MKINKIIVALAVTAIIGSSAAFAIDETTKENVSNGMNDFATELLTAVPEAATQQNVWADAYIGKLFPSFPVHLGGGITIGGSQLDMTGFKNAAESLTNGYNALATSDFATLLSTYSDFSMSKMDFTIPDSFFMPTATVDIRLGGIVLPFDVGICAMMTNPSLFSVDLSNPESILSASNAMSFSAFGFDGTFDYLTIGADIRYCLYEGNLILPKISLGGGYYYVKGEFAVNSSSDATAGSATVTTTANMDLSFKTQVMFLQAQVSKNFAFATIYGGVRGIVSDSANTWAWKYSSVSGDSTISEDNDSGTVSSGNGAVVSDVYQDGKWDFSNIQPQIFAGVGFNFLCFQTTVGACVDVASFFRDNGKYLWSGSFSFRAKM